MKFSLKVKSETVTIEDLQGVEKRYIVSEMSGEALESYFMVARSKIEMKGAEVTELKDFTGIYTSLLCLTLSGPDSKLIPESELKTWPASVQKGLFDIAQRLNGLTVEAKDEVKND